MELYLDHIARVGHAEIQIRGITLVAGYNATGKSTISKSLYAALSSAYQLSEKAKSQKIRNINKFLQIWLSRYNLQNGLKLLTRGFMRTEIKNLLLRPALSYEDMDHKLIKILSQAGVEDIPEECIGELYHWYMDNQDKDEKYYQKFVIQSVVTNVFSEQINTLSAGTVGTIDIADGDISCGFTVEKHRIIDFSYDRHFSEIKPVYITTSDLIDALGSRKGYRDSASLGYNSNANIELADYLLKELRMEEITVDEYHMIEHQKEILNSILDQVVNGDVRVEENRLVYYDNWCKENVELSNIASGMKLFVILKKLISNGVFLGETVLMIDEPETNLHPDWQLKLAELLVLIYKALTMKIYVNSHSPYFVRALEYFASKYEVLEMCDFYSMEPDGDSGMFAAENVTMELGKIYDKLAGPFNQIM